MKALKKTTLSVSSFSLALAVLISMTNASDTKPPNILLIISDDAGYADFGFHGSQEMRTPNLDRFARQSMRFEQAARILRF